MKHMTNAEGNGKNGNGRNDWLKESLSSINGNVSTLLTKVGHVEEHCNYCKKELVRHASYIAELKLADAEGKGEKQGKKNAYKGMDRRTSEKRNKILYLVSIATFCFMCVGYGVITFRASEKKIEAKVIQAIKSMEK